MSESLLKYKYDRAKSARYLTAGCRQRQQCKFWILDFGLYDYHPSTLLPSYHESIRSISIEQRINFMVYKAIVQPLSIPGGTFMGET
jgi:hypothetical protein